MGEGPSTAEARRVVVTGGGSGIGLATVERLRDDGAKVAVLDIDGADGVDCDLRVTVDVSNSESVARAVDAAADALGGLDGLVASAGIFAGGDVTQIAPDEWDRSFAINVRGIYATARAAIPHLRANGGGSIVLVASQLGLVAAPGMAAYCATKGAVISLARAMAQDHSDDGIRVNCVCPGPTDTPLLRKDIDAAVDPAAARAGYERLQLHGRLVRPAEVADAIAYLLSPRAASTIGTALVVDGGYTAR